MIKEVLIIDDEKAQAENLSKALSQVLPTCNFSYEYQEELMLSTINNRFFNLAIVDLRMDELKVDGIHLIREIIKRNPFSKIIIVTAYLGDFFKEVTDLLSTGKILAVLEKKPFKEWIPKLQNTIENYYDSYNDGLNEINIALLKTYNDAKNETDTYVKGVAFENFISLLFASIGYKDISKRVTDKSRNEVDLIIRNEIADNFLNKFGKYIIIECKNKPKDGIGKNDFIQFYSKLRNTNKLSELGILATSGYIGKNTYIEAVRTSNEDYKVIFLSNPEIEILINSSDKASTFKSIIDSQVKDN